MNVLTILMVLPLLVVLTNMVTNVVKGLCEAFANHARLVAPVVAELLTLTATAAWLEVCAVRPDWYWYAGGAVMGAVVAYTAMNGYDGLYEELIKYLKGMGGGDKA